MRKLIKKIIAAQKTPLLKTKHYDRASIFRPENLLREARRQLDIPLGRIPKFVVLDPDGDILEHLLAEGAASLSEYWACYHTKLYQFNLGGIQVGIIGRAVGGSFAVLLAEQLFASGCKLIINITSAGKISDELNTPCYILANKALRDEGTSFHYQAPSSFATIRSELLSTLSSTIWKAGVSVSIGPVWTTDAPYRETSESILAAKDLGLLAVEMETASLYSFAQATSNYIVSFAFVTNQMAQVEDDFEKGECGGAVAALNLINQSIDRLTSNLLLN